MDQSVLGSSFTSKLSSFWVASVHRSSKTSGICVLVLATDQSVLGSSCVSKLSSFWAAANDHRDAEHSALFGEGAEPVAMTKAGTPEPSRSL